jgi:ABC-type Fe3+/spermidine/putrescine transport system ATPase subunit
MNFIEGVVGSDGIFNADGLKLATGTEIRGAATLAVRPENIMVTAAGAGGAGKIVDMAYHGLDRVLHVKIAASETPLQVRVPANAAVPHTVGDTIHIAIDPDRTRLFKN